MATDTIKNNNMLLVKGCDGRSSKTARKFTQFFSGERLPDCISVHLDWLAVMVECFMPEPKKDQAPEALGNGIVLEYENKGTPTFLHTYKVYQWGEPVANIHTHTRNEKIIKQNRAKLEILNHVLYSTSVIQVLHDVMAACNCTQITSYSRVDIAIDGGNHVHEFLNRYVRQNPTRGGIFTTGTFARWDRGTRVRMKGKARLDAKAFNRKNGMYDNFKIGGGNKSFTLYNKTQELERSHKEYIREAWTRAGLDAEQVQWRCELRMNSQAVKEIKNFDLTRVGDPNYLLQLYKTQCKNFFEFVLIEDDTNVSRAKVIDLFQFEKLRVPLLEKIPRAVVRGAYKAQLAIHNAFAHVRLGMCKTQDRIHAALDHIDYLVDSYNLHRWYNKKVPQWEEQYIPV